MKYIRLFEEAKWDIEYEIGDYVHLDEELSVLLEIENKVKILDMVNDITKDSNGDWVPVIKYKVTTSSGRVVSIDSVLMDRRMLDEEIKKFDLEMSAKTYNL